MASSGADLFAQDAAIVLSMVDGDSAALEWPAVTDARLLEPGVLSLNFSSTVCTIRCEHTSRYPRDPLTVFLGDDSFSFPGTLQRAVAHVCGLLEAGRLGEAGSDEDADSAGDEYEYESDDDAAGCAVRDSGATAAAAAASARHDAPAAAPTVAHATLDAHVVDARSHCQPGESVSQFDVVHARLQIQLAHLLDDTTLQAWGLDPALPLVVDVNFQTRFIMRGTHPPSVRVWQGLATSGGDASRGALKQISNIAGTYLGTLFKQCERGEYSCTLGLELSGDAVGTADGPGGGSGGGAAACAGQAAGRLTSHATASDALGHVSHAMLCSSASSGAAQSYDAQVAHLAGMGFGRSVAADALAFSNGDVATALEVLLAGDLQGSSLSAMLLAGTVPGRDPTLAPSAELKRSRPRSRQEQLPFAPEAAGSTEGDFRLTPTSPEPPPHELGVQAAATARGVLAKLLVYLRCRLPRLHLVCVICDQPHLLDRGMLKPCVCARDLCRWSFWELGVMSDCSMATDHRVVDLLVLMAATAAASGRPEILVPYPTIYSPTSALPEPVISLERRDDPRLASILARTPSFAASDARLLDRMRQVDELCPAVLDWVITSNRSHLVELPDSVAFPELGPCHRFLLASAAPEHEAEFQRRKAAHGSVFAFHGSRLENWHSILRQGLKNASGTRLQLHGAAYGSGIYLSPLATTSLGYCAGGSGRWPGIDPRLVQNPFLVKESPPLIVALCEVINGPQCIRQPTPDIWVVADAANVVTRFLFVWPRSSAATELCSVRASDTAFAERARRAIDSLRHLPRSAAVPR